MIHYDAGTFKVRNLSKLTGSVFFATLPAAGLCGLLGFGMRILGSYIPAISGVLSSDGAAYGSFSVLIGFLVIFRTQTGFSRFWQGAQYVKDMQLEFYATGSSLVAFTRGSAANQEEVNSFQCILVRLLSLLSAVAIHDLHGDDSVGQEYRLEVVDPNGLDSASLLTIWHEKCKVELCAQWVQTLAVDSIKSGVLAAPPPVLSRAFQSLSNGLKAYYCAHRLKEVPYPFPYVQTTELLLLIYCILTPLVIAGCTTSPVWTAIFSFFIPLIVLCLNKVASELEDPFGMDHHDLDLSCLQRELNQVLLMLMQPATRDVPTLSQCAKSLVTSDKEFPVALIEMGDMLETLAPSYDIELRGSMVFLPRGASTASMPKLIKGGRDCVAKHNLNSGPESSLTSQSEGSDRDRSPQTGDRLLNRDHGGAISVTVPALCPDSDGPRRQSRDSGTWNSISSDVFSPQSRRSLRIVFGDSTRAEELTGRTILEDTATKAAPSSTQSKQALPGFGGALEEKLCISGRDLGPVVPTAPAADAPEQRKEGSCPPQSLSLSWANLPPLRYALDDTSSKPFRVVMERSFA